MGLGLVGEIGRTAATAVAARTLPRPERFEFGDDPRPLLRRQQRAARLRRRRVDVGELPSAAGAGAVVGIGSAGSDAAVASGSGSAAVGAGDGAAAATGFGATGRSRRRSRRRRPCPAGLPSWRLARAGPARRSPRAPSSAPEGCRQPARKPPGMWSACIRLRQAPIRRGEARFPAVGAPRIAFLRASWCSARVIKALIPAR